jgi:hypothetical protein
MLPPNASAIACVPKHTPKMLFVAAYFLITSSIVDRSEFYGTNGNIACMGLLSKNYQNSDFFFGFQSPITYYIQKDRTINSIT